MPAKKVYLDSSGIVKRYVGEEGSEFIDSVYEAGESGKLKLHFSIWNVGEVLGALDQYLSKQALSEDAFKTALSDFMAESIKLSKLGSLLILPISADALLNCWALVLRYHIYVADALQIATSKTLDCDLLLSADRSVVNVGRQEGLEAFDVETEPERALTALTITSE